MEELIDTHTDQTRKRNAWLFVIVLVLFAVFSAIRVWLAAFPKTMDVTPDELRYLDITRSLFNNGTLVIRGDASTFQKILYPVSLFPALLFNDTIAQVKAMGVLNSIYAASAVFPAYLIAKRLFKDHKVIIICLVLTLIMPDMCYSMGFMTESIFLPLSLWLIWLFWKTMDATGTQQITYTLFSGLFCYIVYLCKEIAVAYAIAFVIIYAVSGIRKTRDRKECALAVGCFLVGFLVPFAIMKLTLFSGLPNSYSQTSPDILLNPSTLFFGAYATAIDAMYAIVGFAFFPIFFVAFTYRDLSQEDKRLFQLCALSLVVGLLIIIYTISIREDAGRVALRQHLRYVSVLSIPMLFLFIKQIKQADIAALKHSPRRMALLSGVTAAFIMLVLTTFGTANLQQGFDNSQFHVFRWFYTLFGDLDMQPVNADPGALSPDYGSLLTVNPGVWLSRFLIAAFVGFGMFGLLSKKRTATGTVIVAIIAFMMVANSVVNYQYNMKVYACDEESVEEAASLDEYLSQLPSEDVVLIVHNAKQTDTDNLADTYIDDRNLRYRFTTADNLADYLGAPVVHDQVSLSDESSSISQQLGVSDISQPRVDYILVDVAQKITFTSTNVQLVDMGNSKNFRLYRVTDGQQITLTRS